MPDNTVPAGNMGNSILNFIYGQQTDPAQQMADWANTQQARNRVAAGMDLQGNVLPTPGPNAQPGVGSGQITGAPQDPTAAMAAVQQTGILPQGQTPNAYKSDQSMGSMIIALQRREEAAAGLQTSLGLAGAAISRPENRDRVFKSFAPQAPMDPTRLGDSLMSLSMQQQRNDQGNALAQMIMDPQRGPQLAQQLGISQEELRARYLADPQGVGTMIASFSAPTEAVKNYNQARAVLKARGMSDEDIDKVIPPETIMYGATTDIGQRQYLQELAAAKAAGGPIPSRLQTFEAWKDDIANQAKLKSDLSMDQQNATQSLPNLNTQLTGVENNIQSILNNPRLPNVLGKALPTTGQFATYFRDPEDIKLAQQIQRLYSQMYSEGFKMGGGSRKTQQELGMLGQAAGDTLAATYLSPDAFKAGLVRIYDQTRAAHANAYGETGNVEDMPTKYTGFLDPTYRQGGKIKVKGAPGALKPLSDDDQKQLPDMIAKNGRDAVVSHLREQGYDTSGL